MIDIVFLGTGCMQPTKARNHSGFLLRFNEENILFDCGENIQRQMRIAGIKPAKITKLLISHWHGDHVFGIPGLMSSMGADQFAKKLFIYGPKGTKKYLEHLFKSFVSKDIIEHEVFEVNAPGIIFENEDFMIESEPLKHSALCVGYKFIEKDRLRINLAKANKLGLEGPVLGKIQQGKNIVHEGRKVNFEELTYVVKGKRIAYIADTIPCEGANNLAKYVDLLISEGTHLSDISEKSKKYMHLTVKDAALIASENNAKKLVLTHISQRYKSTMEIIEEARTYFDDTIVAEDFMKIKV
ncbi:MAG: ribonuclease Z [Nanoarchaeota archaeon]|nr:ribonuclease Z [Nanoarchaeota archaeon]MBU1632160.1 ribonuclease Z [Nanoarchaeota archaeon]MBU1876361.1 ribonuclease Z [Nanoarchaeota archaeon]